jgi:2'-5' RNA ligase
MPRLFVAIDLPEQQRRDLEAICHGLPAETRWTPPEQLHLTVRFIGEVDDHLFSSTRHTLAEIPFTPFWLQIQGLGHFPPGRQAKILWAGVAESPQLDQLQRLIENRLVQLGLAPENRPFHPHLTIARLPPSLAPEVLAAYLARHRRLSSAPFLVDSFHLYSSRLTKHGAIHHREETFSAR